MEQQEKKVTITPSEYFDHLKDSKNTMTNEKLKETYEVFIKLADKYKKLGQTESLKKLCFLSEVLQKEEQLVNLGITTFIYKDTIEDYIENVADKTVKIIELSRYMREIPDELVDTIEKTKPIFDQFYVIFTDYTGKEERKVAQERKDKDPILFGVFKEGSIVADRFYFLGDWIDEYCDLTLDKMITEYKNKKNNTPTNEIEIPETSEKLVEILKTYVKTDEKEYPYYLDPNRQVTNAVINIKHFKQDNTAQNKTSFFDKIKSTIKK